MNFKRALFFGLTFTSLISISTLTSVSPQLTTTDKTLTPTDSLDVDDHHQHVVGDPTHINNVQPVKIVHEEMPRDKKTSSLAKLPPSCLEKKRKATELIDTETVKVPTYSDVARGMANFDALEFEEGQSSPPPFRHPQLSASKSGFNLSSDRHFLVTTLDGKLTLVDQEGREVWALHTGELFSSTISSLQLSENGKFVNLIPSLTGGLYKYDEESLLPMPMNVDSLLHKSFKLSNDVVINGGKELRTFGVDLRTGKLRYDCGMSGCYTPQQNELEELNAEEPVTLVVKKQLQTVRAVDTHSGTEKWNFSVGTHSIGLTGVTEGCMEEEDKDDQFSSAPLGFVKVVIPEGRLLSANPTSKTMWDKKFNSPIAQAWVLENGKLTYVDPVKNTPLKEGPLALYVGKFNQQFYVQESRQLSHRLERLLGYPNLKTSDVNEPPKIAWKPSYHLLNDDMESDSSKVTALTQISPARSTLRPFYVLEHDEIISETPTIVEVTHTSPIPPRSHNNVFQDNGQDKESPFPKFDYGKDENDDDTMNIINDVIIGSLWYWWKEVLGISLLTAVLLNILLMRPLMRAVRLQTIRDIIRYLRHFANRDQQEGQVPLHNEMLQLLPACDTPTTSTISRPRTVSDSFSSLTNPFVELPEQEYLYVSQYLREFEPVQCLGKGGFGVVFEAKKKIDDRNYAVKRIALPNREEARIRVMREVKALAQLDHKNIVRYFNAWIENPPNGWLEKNDPLWANCHVGSISPTVEYPTSGMTSLSESKDVDVTGTRRNMKITMQQSLEFNARVPLLEEEDSFIVFDDNLQMSSRGDAAAADESFANIRTQKDVDTHTTIDLSEASSLSGSTKGLWKKPNNANNPHVSWDLLSADERNQSFSKSRVVFESEVGDKLNDSIEVGEEAQEIKSSSIMYLYIQQELCQKRTLREWLRTEINRDLRTVVTLFGQIVEAVEYVHSKKLIHRDLKPGNIFLAGNQSDGEEHVLKVGDFGLATTVLGEVTSKNTHTNEEKKRNNDTNLTSLVGTQLYMSPEQFKRKPYDYKVDIYSLGIIFFELLVPFQTEMERHDVLSQVRKAKIPFFFKDTYPEEHSLIVKMISRNPNHRPDASSINQWVKSHLRYVDSLAGDSKEWNPDLITHRSNSSPGHISLSRCGSSGNQKNNRSRNPNTAIEDADRPIRKSHSFTFASS